MSGGLVDAHVHVWDPRVLDYGWVRTIAALDRPSLPGEIDDADGAVSRMVFVQAGAAPTQSLDEARWATESAPHWPQLAGIVAAADLRSDALGAHLDALAALPRVVGVRHILQAEPVERFADASLRRGLEQIRERGLTFDACVVHPQLDALADLLESVPGLPVVLDHLGKPPVDDGIDSPAGRAWTRAIDRIAGRGETSVKLSGLGAEASAPDRLADNGDAFLAYAFARFGASRAMIGSDWPVSARLGAATTTRGWVGQVARATGATDAEWREVSAGSAARFYGLDG
ncbi:amidohydrolase family protein [Microbacterium sp. BWT-B31]|uniref:amidohydrolase family protein n=1 Tax=Microbacterium sp. BWT-B31 TaxID=3232072 RepID=UPI0035297289